MSEFKIHHLVSELMKTLGVSEKENESVSSDSYVEYLVKNRTQYVTTRISSGAAVKKLSQNSPNAAASLKKYEDLKVRNFREVDALACLLSEISSDNLVKGTLEKTVQNGYENRSFAKNSLTYANGGTTDYELQKLRDKLQQRMAAERSEQSKETLQKRNVPPGIYKFPSWVKERPYLSWDFVNEPRVDNVKVGPICVLPKNVQENLLIRDLLYCLSGIEGDYITLEILKDPFGPRNFKLDPSTDPALMELTKRILPVAADYSLIIRFIEEKSNFEYGLVNHALCAAIRHMLRDYFILIAQLENQHLSNNLSLQKIWFYIQPVMHKLRTVAMVAHIMNKGDCFGGTVLSVLHERASALTGDAAAQEICSHLAQEASVPYFEILEKWIYKGIISDPYSEFSVEDNELVKKDELPIEYSDDYWEKRYTIRREQIPLFLEKVTDMILRTGKYLNVIRQCGQNIKCPNAKPLTYVAREQVYFETIRNAYNFASKKLLDLLLENNDLRGRLRSVKHYFLLDQGDFIVQFMDMAEEELFKDIDDIMPTRLETLLELALRTSVVNSDKYKDDIKVELLPYDLLTQLFKILMISPENQKDYGSSPDMPITGLEAFAFDYEVKWPLSLVINRRALAYYQMLFRHLFYCKHVERLLGRVWTLNKVAKAYPMDISSSYSSAFALCQRMLNFIQNLDYYITLEVIEPHWQAFLCKMDKVSNVDEVLECHKDFLDNCLKDCMLTFPELLQVLGKLIKLCVTVSHFMQETHSFAVEAEYSSMGDSLLSCIAEEPVYQPPRKPGEHSVQFQQSFQQKISQFQTEFDTLFVTLLDLISGLNMIKCSAKMVNMLYRLDFNGFYARHQESAKSQSSSNQH